LLIKQHKLNANNAQEVNQNITQINPDIKAVTSEEKEAENNADSLFAE
jgi:molybdopterin/thiamine biosynthesis adenylyltransferase